MGFHSLLFKLIREKSKKLTLLQCAGYFFMFAICAKLIAYVETNHPVYENLLPVQGIVHEVKLGGPGSSTYLKVESREGIHRYSSYFGEDWPGMEYIRIGDRINLLVEKNKLNKRELITGKEFYMWELIHNDQIIIKYEDVRELVLDNEAVMIKFIHLWLVISFSLLIIVYGRKVLNKPQPG
jgi:hypothetical protein